MFEILTYPFSLFYQLLVFIDKRIKLKNQKKIHNSFVISIGNLTLGGTGKTPFTLHLAKMIQKNFSNSICVLSRGYKGKKSKEGMEVKKNSLPELCGDEPLLLKRENQNLTVIIGKNRFQSYQNFAKKNHEFVLLDDGFQHYKIFRDLDIVLIDSTNPFGNGLTLPFGILREPLPAIKRANIIIFSKYQQNYKNSLLDLQKYLLAYNKNLQFFYFSYQFEYLKNSKNENLELQVLKDKKIFVFSGIGNISFFLSMIKKLQPKKITSKSFADHFDFSDQDIHKIQKKSKEYDFVICTKKDFVKVKNPFTNLYFLSLKTFLHEEKKFIQILSSFCSSLK